VYKIIVIGCRCNCWVHTSTFQFCVHVTKEYAILCRNVDTQCRSILGLHTVSVGVSHNISYIGFSSPSFYSLISRVCCWCTFVHSTNASSSCMFLCVWSVSDPQNIGWLQTDVGNHKITGTWYLLRYILANISCFTLQS